MAGTVRWTDQKLIFTFPFDREANEALRRAAGGSVRWSQGLRAHVIAVGRDGLSAAQLGPINRFIVEYGLQVDREAYLPLGLTPPGTTDSGSAAGSRFPLLAQGRLRADLLPSSTWGSNLRASFPALTGISCASLSVRMWAIAVRSARHSVTWRMVGAGGLTVMSCGFSRRVQAATFNGWSG